MSDARILVVDSDLEHGRTCSAWLMAVGFDVEIAETVSRARSLADGDVVAAIVDPIADDATAAPLIRELRSRGVPVAEVSDVFVGETNAALAAALNDASAFWEKPVPSEELVAWLREELGERFPELPPSREEVADDGGASPTQPLSVGRLRRSARSDERSVSKPAAGRARPGGAIDTDAVGDWVAPRRTQSDLFVPPPLDVENAEAQGTLEDHLPITLAARFAFDRVDGRWLLRDGEKKKIVHLRGGAVADVHSNLPSEEVGAVLRDSRRIGPRELESIDDRVAAGEDPWDAARDAAGFDEQEIAWLRRWRIRLMLAEILAWDSGRYQLRVEPSAVPPQLLISPATATWEAARHTVDSDDIRRHTEGLAPYRAFWFERPTLLDERGLLDGAARNVIEGFDAGLKVSAVLSASGDPDAARRTLFFLTATGFIGFRP